MTDDESDEVKKGPTFRAKVTVFVRTTIDVEVDGDVRVLTVSQAASRSQTAAYEKVREAFGGYQAEKTPLVEVVA